MNIFDLNWYHSLHRPKFSPPDWIFAPAWSVLYVMIFVSLIFFISGDNYNQKIFPLAVFSLQLILNILWTPVFFRAKKILSALIIIIALWVCIACVICLFYPFSKISAILLVPYFLWVSYATWLNFEIWRLNR